MRTPQPSLSPEGLSRLGGLLAGLDRLAPILKLPDVCGPADPGLEFGRFVLSRRLGTGRFGIVLLAGDPELRRSVVVKVPQPAVLTDPAARERFLREARSAARLDHPGIIPIYEAGEIDGLPYLVAGFVNGPTMAEWMGRKGGPIPAPAAARLVAQLAAAVHHAHERGVLHCDLTPSNVLLVDGDNQEPEPLVTDFGLSRFLEDDPALTRTFQIAGTPRYMAPEQARGDRRNLTARADVYSLGVILYELLTGAVPFAADSGDRVLYHVVHTVPAPPRLLIPELSRDLEAVCLKCLEKDPANRYQTADELAADLGRFLRGTTTLARPVGPLTNLGRAVRRRPAFASLIGISILALGSIPAVATWFTLRLDEEASARLQAERDGDRDRNLAKTREYYATLERVRVRRLELRSGWAAENLADLRTLAGLIPPDADPADLRSEAVAAAVAVDLRPVHTVAEGFRAYFPAYSPTGDTLALCGWEQTPDGRGVVRLYDPTNGLLRRELTFPLDPNWDDVRESPDGCRTVAFSPNGRWLVAGTRSGHLVRWDLSGPDPQPVVWAGHVSDHAGNPEHLNRVFVRSIAFTADGRTMITSSRLRSQKWDAGNGWAPIGPREPYRIPLGTSVLTGSLTASVSDEKRWNSTVRIDPVTGIAEATPILMGDEFATSADGRIIAGTTGTHATLSLFGNDLAYDPVPLSAAGRTDRFVADYLGFSPGVGLLASSEEVGRRIKLWDVASGELLADRPFAGGSGRFAFSPDGRYLAVAEASNAVVYEITGRARETVAVSSRRFVRTFTTSPSGTELVVHAQGNSRFVELTTWDVRPDEPVRLRSRFHHNQFIADVSTADYHPTKAEFAYSTSRGNANSPNADGDLVVYSTAYSMPCESLSDIRFDPLGRLWVVDRNGMLVWNVGTKPPWRGVSELKNDAAATAAGMVFRAVAPGRRVAVLGRRDGNVFVVKDLIPPVTPIHVFDSAVTAVALAPDEKSAIVGGERGELIRLSLPDGIVRATYRAHSDAVRSIAYGPGGWYATGSSDRTVKLWSPTGHHMLTLRTGSAVCKLMIGGDGSTLTVLLENERAVRRWRLNLILAMLSDLGLPFDPSTHSSD